MTLFTNRNALVAALSLALCTAPAVVCAQVVYEFDQPVQSLADALRAAGSKAGVNVAFEPESVRGRQAPALEGRYSAREALERLIQGTGLVLGTTEGGSFLVEDPKTPGGPQGSTETTRHGVQTAIPEKEAGDWKQSSGTEYAKGSSEVADLGRIVVVGSRIGNTQPTSPVITLSREDLDRSGAVSASDAMKLVPQNWSGTTSSTSYVTSGNLGFTNKADIRGLGPQATLTLLNGRRISAAAGGGGDAVDLGLIPSAAIERIEVLTDSASALYGSDAIGGVINFVLREDYDGAEVSARRDWNIAGADGKSSSAMFGRSWESGSFLAGLQYQSQDALRFDRIGIDSTDFTVYGGGDFRTPLAGNPGNVLPLGFQYGLPFDTISGADGMPVFMAAIPAGQDGTALSIADLRLNDANLGSFLPEELTPENRRTSVYANFRQSLGSIDVFADIVASDRRQQTGSSYIDFLYVPSSNAFSPFDEDVFVGYLTPSGDFGRYSIEARSGTINAGVEGRTSRNWAWKVFGIQSRDKSRTSVSLPDPLGMMQALASSDPALAFNPFGDRIVQSAAVLESILTKAVAYGRTRLGSVNVEAEGRLFELPGGDAKLALAAEHRKEALTSGSHLVTESPRNSIDEDRRVQAVAAELFFPLIRQGRSGARELDLSLAGRWEKYSDFGSTFNPRVGMRWKLAGGLSFKASWGTAFRAPSLRQLFIRETVIPVTQVLDPNAPGGPALVFAELAEGGNPYLKEEHAETWSTTLEFSPARIPGLSAALTWYRIDYRDRIRGLLDGLDIATFLTFEPSLPPGLVQRDAHGNLERINLTDINSATTLVEGMDLSAGYSVAVGSGYMHATGSVAAFTRYQDLLIEGAEEREVSGRVGSPADWRARMGLAWSSNAWNAAMFVSHVDGLKNEDADPRIVRRTVDAQTTVDFQLGYDVGGRDGSMLDDWSVRLGVLNAFDTRAPFVDGQQYAGVDAQNFRIGGRTIYLQISKSFGPGSRVSQ